MRVAVVVCLGWLAIGGGCTRRVDDKADAAVTADTDRLRCLFDAEVSRDASVITVADLSNRDVRVRRSAVRALARISIDPSRGLLERSLADEDPEVVAWAGFGLGRICTLADSEATIRRIVARAATLSLTLGPGSSGLSDSRLDPWFAFAQALGRCATPESERVLRSWMSVSSELARVAVQGLDYYVQSTKNLDASTIVALLDAADKDRTLVGALLSVSHLTKLDPLVGRRLLALAPRLLETAGDERRFLLRALPLAGELAIPILERIVVDDGHYQPLERVEAIRAIGKMDAIGQVVLARLLPRISSFGSTPSEALLLSSKWALLSELFEQLKEVPKSARATLSKLATLDAADGKKPAALRRISYLRCRAAALLTAEDVFAPLIEQCDLSEEQREKKHAQLAILDRLRLEGRHASAFETLAADRDPVVAMAALGLLSTHDELQNSADLLAAALGAESMGIVTTAARVLAEHPQRAKRGRQPNAELSTALERAMLKNWPVDAVEVRASLIDAAAELGFLSVKGKIVAECANAVSTIRQHAERALHRLGEPKQLCLQPVTRELPKETSHLASKPLTLRFHTDIGPLEIRLDSNLAPLALTRLVDLAKAGFYDGIIVHRVVAGFVVQLGDRSADGYGGAGQPALPCELSPQPFGPLDVGMALSGSDSGSSQFFVTLGPYPQLGGEYSRVGRAGAGWDQLFVGDRILKVEVVP